MPQRYLGMKVHSTRFLQLASVAWSTLIWTGEAHWDAGIGVSAAESKLRAPVRIDASGESAQF